MQPVNYDAKHGVRLAQLTMRVNDDRTNEEEKREFRFPGNKEIVRKVS